MPTPVASRPTTASSSTTHVTGAQSAAQNVPELEVDLFNRAKIMFSGKCRETVRLLSNNTFLRWVRCHGLYFCGIIKYLLGKPYNDLSRLFWLVV